MAESSDKPTVNQAQVVPVYLDAATLLHIYSNHVQASFRMPEDVTLDFCQVQPQTAEIVDGVPKMQAIARVRVCMTVGQAISLCAVLAQGLGLQVQPPPRSDAENV